MNVDIKGKLKCGRYIPTYNWEQVATVDGYIQRQTKVAVPDRSLRCLPVGVYLFCFTGGKMNR